ncbi:hypothetical protein [Natrinema versiforme]|uniref:Uncharacterized protein n=1 Tax=Natrinema versiforme TaxID=88724 RepID=A0A4P8WPN9_9EURY|nr:hypothetical protein [Natrinema versiforme]QCS44091.1 hypothetical protein FEJ81_17725 [Natrinema versiforme]
MPHELGNSRRKLLGVIGSAGAILTAGSGRVLAADTGEKHPEVDVTIYNETVREIASHTDGFDSVPGVDKHLTQNRVAFISPYGEGTLNLFVAEGIQSSTDKADKVYRITDSPKAGVYDPKWYNEDHLLFQKNLTRYSLKIPQSYVVNDEKVLEENVVERNEITADFSLGSLPKVPTSLPFNICVPFGRSKWCVQAEDLAVGKPRECNQGKTPPLASSTVHLQQEKLSLDGWSLETDMDIWAGVEEDGKTVWVGAPDGECARYDVDPPNPGASIDDVIDSLDDIEVDLQEWIEKHGGPNKGTASNSFLALLLLVVVAIIFVVEILSGTAG